MNLQELCEKTAEVAREAGRFIRSERRFIRSDDVQLKSKASLVTYVDKQSEKFLVEQLQQLLPQAGFITEEGTATTCGQQWNWVIDPLDGTTNFVHDIFPHSVSIGLLCDNVPVLGAVYEIGHDEMFTAWQGGGAWLNGRRISVSKADRHEDVLLATGFPYYNFELLGQYLKLLEFFMIETQGMRRMGSAAVDMAYVACGRFDGFFEHALHPWDIAAGIILVQEAGGRISDFKGGNNHLFGKEIVASNAAYFPQFFQKVNEFLGQP
ncbi:MAG: inositol monophosphatase [Bacteroidales bacterium]|jgi:myo-inositol-1(or 4)-monophosphatase|nr:inositol monophosphatase [Bacteroidales bacterium]